MRHFFPLEEQHAVILHGDDVWIEELLSIAFTAINKLIETEVAKETNRFFVTKEKLIEISYQYIKLILKYPVKDKKLSNRRFAKYLLKAGIDEVVFRDFWYTVCFQMIEESKIARESSEKKHALQIIFGHNGGDMERAIFLERNRVRKDSFSKYDKLTFEAYNEAVAHNVTNSIMGITGLTNNLIACIKVKSEYLESYVGEAEEDYNTALAGVTQFLKYIKLFSSSSDSRTNISKQEFLFILERVICDRFMEKISIAVHDKTQNDFLLLSNELRVIRAIYPVVQNAIEAKAETIGLYVLIENDHLSVSIINDGKPIGDKRQIFNDFYSTKGQRGCGLSYALENAEDIILVPSSAVEFRITMGTVKTLRKKNQ